MSVICADDSEYSFDLCFECATCEESEYSPDFCFECTTVKRNRRITENLKTNQTKESSSMSRPFLSDHSTKFLNKPILPGFQATHDEDLKTDSILTGARRSAEYGKFAVEDNMGELMKYGISINDAIVKIHAPVKGRQTVGLHCKVHHHLVAIPQDCTKCSRDTGIAMVCREEDCEFSFDLCFDCAGAACTPTRAVEYM
jgi:hypothetical protein